MADTVPTGTWPQDGAHSLSLELVNQMPDALREVTNQSYNETLIPVFLSMTPLAVLAAMVLFSVTEKTLSTSVEGDVPAESLAKGALVVSSGR